MQTAAETRSDSQMAVIAGAAGLVGGELLKILKADRVIALVRKPLAEPNPGVEQVITDFDRLETLTPVPVTHAYCALGTTIRKAGSPAAFRRVDFEYPLAFARTMLGMGARQFLLVSSVGAAADSSNLYLRVKGELERELAALPFEALHIFQPSILLGERSESRPGEQVGQLLIGAFGFALIGGLSRYRGMPADTLARAMAAAAQRGRTGKHVYQYNEIMDLAGK